METENLEILRQMASEVCPPAQDGTPDWKYWMLRRRCSWCGIGPHDQACKQCIGDCYVLPPAEGLTGVLMELVPSHVLVTRFEGLFYIEEPFDGAWHEIGWNGWHLLGSGPTLNDALIQAMTAVRGWGESN